MRWKALLALGKAIPLTITIVSGVAAAQDRDQMVQSLLTDARIPYPSPLRRHSEK
jgi:hypothetical protein